VCERIGLTNVLRLLTDMSDWLVMMYRVPESKWAFVSPAYSGTSSK